MATGEEDKRGREEGRKADGCGEERKEGMAVRMQRRRRGMGTKWKEELKEKVRASKIERDKERMRKREV